ncbi:MAG: ATP-binding protein [Bryobacteraceae bacterium]
MRLAESAARVAAGDWGATEQFDEVFREGAATLLAELANLKQIIRRFSDFARMPAPEMRPVSFNELVSDALKLFEPQLAQARVRTSVLESGVRLEVSDTGQGLTPGECSRLFTPYYTTKTHGTGLGLAIVQSVVSDHHGRVSVESAPGKGTTFRIELG